MDQIRILVRFKIEGEPKRSEFVEPSQAQAGANPKSGFVDFFL